MREAPSSEEGNDLIFVRSLNLKATTGVDFWKRPRPQPILLSIWLKSSVALAGSTDHLPYSINYGTVAKSVSALVEDNTFHSLEHLVEKVARLALSPVLNGEWVKVVVEKPRALLRADAAGISITRKKEADGSVVVEGEDKVFVKNLRLVTIIGVNSYERLEKQNVTINLTMHKPNESKKSANIKSEQLAIGETQAGKFYPSYDFRTVAQHITEHIEASDYKTVEAFVTAVAREACVKCGVSKITVQAEKPSALTFAECPGVEITRERSFFNLEEFSSVGEGKHDVFLAIGSNVGDRFKAVKDSLVELEKRGITVKRTSNLYQSAPMYVLDQPTFLNGVVQVETTLSPHDLLKTVKEIEDTLGRIKVVEKGPRSIDLDILLYDDLTLNTEDLIIPHAAMLEREFVLRPLCDIAPERAHPLTSTAFKHHLSALPPAPLNTPLLRTFISLSSHLPPLDPSNPHRPTLLMAVLNLTPDSFSDGGKHLHSSLITTTNAFIASGASIIDIGGQSTRPGAQDVGADEEIRRVIPAIKAIRAAGITVPISIDTYRASVAKAAIEAGADIINDISSGRLDPDMFTTVAQLGVPICIMHMRGTPVTMNEHTSYPDGVIATIASELAERVRAAEEAGVRRWNIILDPGLGFAKTMAGNLEVIRNLGQLTRWGGDLNGMPWLLGPSRKRFVGTITGVEMAGERQWGTAGAVAACVCGGADIVRVHDVDEMKKVVDMAVAIWRSSLTDV
ncbi:Dihydropteroate synthase-like protein [Morchella snyderi]|nr:Dihydropteroate synthase-like protein [Morchella snyderi]